MLFNLKKDLNVLKPKNFFFEDKFPNSIFKRKNKDYNIRKNLKIFLWII